MIPNEVKELPLRPQLNGNSHADVQLATEASEPVDTPLEAAEIDKERDEVTENHGVITSNPLDLPIAKKKKKKKRKPASKRGIEAPTGMETFFADAPLTLAEFDEEQQLYGRDLPFIDRILTAMQRFERTRRLSPERRDIFYKWLHYGGIIIGPSAFGSGLDQENMDKGELATALSQIQIPDDLRKDLESTDSNDPKYAIDFLGCMRAFLSYRAPVIYYFAKKDEVDLVTSTLERFMDYLMQHDVCPEYASDIMTTRNFCREANDELWSTSEARRWLPGDFNMACSTLFGGNYGKIYDGKTYWGDIQPGDSAFVGFTPEQATQIVGLGIAGAASEDVYNQYAELIAEDDGAGLDTVKVIEASGFEIVSIERATTDCKDLYKNNSNEYRPVGRAAARPWKDPLSPPEDLTEDERRAITNLSTGEIYVFFLEEIILQNLSVGQKIIATVRQLNCGAWFFDEFVNIYPNYEFWTSNDLVEDYKPPRMLPGAYAPGAVGFVERKNGDRGFGKVVEEATEELNQREESKEDQQEHSHSMHVEDDDEDSDIDRDEIGDEAY